MIRHFFLIVIIIFSSLFIKNAKAQTYELGVSFLGSNFYGDATEGNFKIAPLLQPVFSIMPGISGIGRYNISPYVSFRGDLSWFLINLWAYDLIYRVGFPFKLQNIISFDLLAEYNFFLNANNNAEAEYNFIIPYVFLGAGNFFYRYLIPDLEKPANQIKLTSEYSFSIPFGIGLKFLLSNSNDYYISTEYKMVYTFTDNLDWSNPKDINKITKDSNSKYFKYGNLHNNDGYGLLTISFFYILF